jgi:sigma-B regulation protein RsbU (phosphoserine phosphatase)
LLAEDLVFMARGDPGVDESFEQAIGVRTNFAAIGVGEGTTHVVAFSLRGAQREKEVFFTLSLVRHIINQRLQQRRWSGIIDAARIQQEGILPTAPPDFGDYEIASAFRAAAVVSGDLFDYLPVSPCCLGLAIADACGHGLPAALLARDVITSLRTAAGLGLSVEAIVEGVNAVIQHTALSGTFVSLFYGQLSLDGRLDFCNAGHEFPLLLGRGGLRKLDAGGAVIGLLPAARYESGSVVLEPGDMLLLYSDGISERMNAEGEVLGSERIEDLAARLLGMPAREVAVRVMAEADLFAAGVPAPDDMTVVVVRRPEARGASSVRGS